MKDLAKRLYELGKKKITKAGVLAGMGLAALMPYSGKANAQNVLPLETYQSEVVGAVDANETLYTVNRATPLEQANTYNLSGTNLTAILDQATTGSQVQRRILLHPGTFYHR